MSVYYKEEPLFLQACLDSIFNQTIEPTEVVLIKDGPLPIALERIIENFILLKNNIKIIRNESNFGLSKSLNIGLKECKYEYVARMDSDDICRKDRFELLLNHVAKNPEIDILGSWAIKIDNHGKEIGLLRTLQTNLEIHEYIWTCPFIHPTVIFKKSKIIQAGSYNPMAGPRQDDYDLWFRCSYNKLKFENLSDTLLYYRFNDATILKNNIRVGWSRFKVGFYWCRKLNKNYIAFIGITIPLIRSLLPYPFNLWFNNIANHYNPRIK
jgi:glycosyltransferase involved in cell wall biosynthesis